jgi:hypothetical protein
MIIRSTQDRTAQKLPTITRLQMASVLHVVCNCRFLYLHHKAMLKVRPGTDGAVTETNAGGDIETATGDGATVPADIIANAYSGDKASSSKLEALRAQSQALTSIAQALILQIQALNKQVDYLL